MAEPKLGNGIGSTRARLATSRGANISRRRLPATTRKERDATGVPHKGRQQGRIGEQLTVCIIGTLQIWELLTTLIRRILQNQIDTQNAMSTGQKSLIPIIVRKRPTAAVALAVETDTETDTETDAMNTASQAAVLTPSTQSLGSQMLVQMPQPGTIGAPWFTGQNVSDFLSEFESICDDAHLTDAAKVARVPRYCFPEIGRYLKGIPEWEEGNWDALKAMMHKEWEGTDDFQHTRTLAFLEVLKNQNREHIPTQDIRHYCRQFKQSATYLRKIEQISEYQASTWFLQGLPRTIAAKVVRDRKLDIDKPGDMKLSDMYECVLQFCDESVKFQRMYKPNNTEEIEALIKRVPTRPVVLDPNSAEVWRPATLLPGASQERLIARGSDQHQGGHLSQQRDADYENILLDKMSKLSIRNIRAELARERGNASGRGFPSPGPGNQAMTQTNGQANRNPPWRSGDLPGTVTCFFCDEIGHFKNDCPIYVKMQKDGKVHENADRRTCVGPEEEKGWEIRFRWNMGSQAEQAETQYREYVKHMISRSEGRGNPKVQAIKIGVIGSSQTYSDIENDTEEESGDEDYDHIGVAASRAVTRAYVKKTVDQPSVGQGPALDTARRVIKDKQEWESRLPAPKNTRFGKYRPAVAAAQEGEDIIMDLEEADIEHETTEDFSSPTYNQNNVLAAPPKTDATKSDKTGLASTSGKRLVTVLNQDKFTGARSLVKAMMDSKVENLTMGDLLAGSGDARRLLFSAREWESNEGGLTNTGTTRKTPLKVSSARVPLVSSTKTAENERSFFAPSPQVDIMTPDGQRPALLDTGAEINVISLDMARKMRLVITRLDDAKLGIMSYRGDVDNFVGVVCDAPITVHGIRTRAHIFVAKAVDEEYCMILGRPWQISAESAIWQMGDGSCQCRITDEETGRQVEFHVAEATFRGDHHKKMLQNLGRSLGVQVDASLKDMAEGK
jgi:hypothetical protein